MTLTPPRTVARAQGVATAFALVSASIAIALLFSMQLSAIWEYRVDYPIADDWRYYIGGYAMPDAFSPTWLLAPARDTVHASGKFIDWFFFRFVGHDYHLLAVASFALFLGGWLIAALRLAQRLSSRRPPVFFASLLVFCLPLAGVPYWVTTSPKQRIEPVIAYHQMLPVLGLVLLAILLIGDLSRWRKLVAPTLAGLATIVFGLSYSSGAFALFVFGASILGLILFCHVRNVELPRSPAAIVWTITGTAFCCLLLHIGLPMSAFDVNPLVEERTKGLSYTLPFEPRFWWYFCGLFDRSVHSTTVGPGATLRGAAVAIVFLLPASGLSILVGRGAIAPAYRMRAIILIAIPLVTLAYAALVSYGRAGFGASYVPNRGDAAVSLYAHNRFFFWWISAALPMAVIAWGVWIERSISKRASTMVVITLAIALLWPKPSYQSKSPRYFQQWNYELLYQRDVRKTMKRVKVDVRNAGRGKSAWPLVNHHEKDAKEVYRRARRHGATFVDKHGLLRGERASVGAAPTESSCPTCAPSSPRFDRSACQPQPRSSRSQLATSELQQCLARPTQRPQQLDDRPTL